MDNLLTVPQVAEKLNCHPQTVYKNKEIPRIVIPGVGVRFRELELQEYIEKRTIKPPPEILQLAENKLISLISPPGCGSIKAEKSGGGGMAKAKSKTRYNFGYGAIYQRKTKKGKTRWYLDYRDSNGKRIQKVAIHAITMEEAHEALKNAILQEHYRQCGTRKKEKRVTFTEFADMYIENYARANKKSWQDDLYRIEANMKPFFGGIILQEVDPLLIEKYRALRLKKGVTKSTVNREITIMKKMFNLAIDWNYVDNNPVLKIKLFSEKDTQKERILSEEEEARLLRECPENIRTLVITALDTGMRRGEIFNLKWKHIDFSEKIIRVEHTKSGRNREIPIGDRLYQLLVELLQLKGNTEYVFPNPDTGRPFKDIKKSFKFSCKRAGISDLRFHDLRHTFASRLVKAGVDLITVRDLLGHFSVRVTQRYTHSCMDQKKQAIELLSQVSSYTPKKRENLLHKCYVN